jgi:hypothetical protein
MIKNGFILQPRVIQDSEIASAPPHVREIWLWILRQANYKDNKVCQRGQCVRSYDDIREGLAWYVGWRKCMYKKHHCEIAMRWLKKATMITTRKTTRGMLITVLKYDYYQDPDNYESYNESSRKATRKIQSVDTINKKEKKEKNILQSNRTSSTEEKPSYGNMLIKKFKQLIAENNNNVVPVADSEAKTNRVYWNILQMLGVKKEHKAVIDTKELPVEVRVNINKFLDWFNAERTNKGLVVENAYTLKQNVLNFKTNFNAKT